MSMMTEEAEERVRRTRTCTKEDGDDASAGAGAMLRCCTSARN
jgi:hypothetical protein